METFLIDSNSAITATGLDSNITQWQAVRWIWASRIGMYSDWQKEYNHNFHNYWDWSKYQILILITFRLIIQLVGTAVSSKQGEKACLWEQLLLSQQHWWVDEIMGCLSFKISLHFPQYECEEPNHVTTLNGTIPACPNPSHCFLLTWQHFYVHDNCLKKVFFFHSISPNEQELASKLWNSIKSVFIEYYFQKRRKNSIF